MSEYLTPWSWEPLIYIQMVRTGGNLDFLLISEVVGEKNRVQENGLSSNARNIPFLELVGVTNVKF